MLLLFVISLVILKTQPKHDFFLLLKAFSEAALVGALADWFAVTALFRHPLGINIPHTNIIASKKNILAEQLGTFILENFFETKTIKPYIKKIGVSQLAFEFLSNRKKFNQLISPIEVFLVKELKQLDSTSLEKWLVQQTKNWLADSKLHRVIGQQTLRLVNSKDYLPLENKLLMNLHQLLMDNETLIKTKIMDNSYRFTPKFIDEKIAEKVYLGLLNFANDIVLDTQHEFRLKCRTGIVHWANNRLEDSQDSEKLNRLLKNILHENMDTLLLELFSKSKHYFLAEISKENSPILDRIRELLYEKIQELSTEKEYFEQLDNKIQTIVFTLFYKNKEKIANHIEATIQKWDAKQLSSKLELEIGKDLQFIRINGTLVGGIIGIFIYFLENLILQH